MSDNRVLSIFRRLAKPGVCLLPCHEDRQESSFSGTYRIGDARDGREKGPLATAADIRDWLSQDLIESCAEGYRLSRAGAAWLKRKLSGTGDFQAQHQSRSARIIEIGGVKRPAMVNDAESPLAWLASRKDKTGAPLLAPHQLEAGERLRSDYQFAGLTARVTSSWSPAAHCNKSDGGQNEAASLQDNVMAARQRVVRALAAVGPELCGVLVDVCCHLKGLEEAEKSEGWPQRSGKVILQIALNRLARHYGLISGDEMGARLRRKLVHWGAEDYRPRIGGETAS
jgi:hypothetical protein